jgi:hypothetical protein
MMTTVTKVPYLDKWKYTAVSLPLSETANAGNFIIVLPKDKTTLVSITTLRITTLSIMKASINGIFGTFGIDDSLH